MSSSAEFWPDGARLAVTVSMMFEAGGQPISGAHKPRWGGGSVNGTLSAMSSRRIRRRRATLQCSWGGSSL
jgi:hypothetical protein